MEKQHPPRVPLRYARAPMNESDLEPLPRPTPPAGAGNPGQLLRGLPAVNDVLDILGGGDLDGAPREEWLEARRAQLQARMRRRYRRQGRF